MRISILIIMAFMCAPASAARAEKISFNGGGVAFTMEKTATQFIFTDRDARRSLDIKACNKKTIERFWNTVRGKIKKYPKGVPAHSRDFRYLLRARERSHLVFLRSHKQCRKS